MESTLEIHPNGVAVVKFSERLDLLNAAEAKQKLSQVVAEGHPRLIVDLKQVPFIDSSGLGALIGGLKAARLAGGDLRLACVGEQARVVLQLTTLDRVLRPYVTVEEALTGY